MEDFVSIPSSRVWFELLGAIGPLLRALDHRGILVHGVAALWKEILWSFLATFFTTASGHTVHSDDVSKVGSALGFWFGFCFGFLIIIITILMV